MKEILLIVGVVAVCSSQAYAEDTGFMEGKKLFKDNCLVCHNAQLDPPQAPPMFGVQMKYKMATQDKESFVRKLTSFATQPTAAKALLKEPVQMLGVMPDMGFEKEDVRKIAVYIHDETFAPPCFHWKSAMKRFKAKGDLKHYKSHKKRYEMMCQKDGKQAAEEGSLQAIMQQLGQDYASIDDAILMEDFDAAAKAAYGIAFHDTPSMSTKMKLMANLRTEMPNFKTADEKVHHLALDIEKAAKAKDMKTLIAKQSQMLSACMACHTSFRSRVVKILH